VATTAVWGASLNLNGAAALFMGIQSGAIAYAKKKIWNEKTSKNQGSFTQECVTTNDVNSGEARYEYAQAA
jgi:hypothetical protein